MAHPTSPSSTPKPQLPTPRKSHLRQLALILAAFVTLATVAGAALVGGVGYLLYKSEPYQLSLDLVTRHPQVAHELGEPVESALFPMGSVTTTMGGSGNASFEIALSGPRGQATAYVTSARQAGRWHLERALLRTRGGEVDLLRSVVVSSALRGAP